MGERNVAEPPIDEETTQEVAPPSVDVLDEEDTVTKIHVSVEGLPIILLGMIT